MKDAYYFPHDYNARGDEKIVNLLKEMGWEGYGIYWAIIEKIYEADGEIRADWDCIAYDLRTQCERIKQVATKYDLFYTTVPGGLRSLSVDRRLKEREQRSESARLSASFRWKDANAMRTHSGRNARKEKKGKEKKGKEKKGNIRNISPNGEAPVKVLIDFFFDGLKKKLGEKPSNFNGGAAGQGFKNLLQSFREDDIKARVLNWFDSADKFIAKRGWRVEDFFNYFNQTKDGPISDKGVQWRDGNWHGPRAEPGKYKTDCVI